MKNCFIYLYIITIALVFSSCDKNIENLSVSKSRVIDYYESGEYEDNLQAALEPAYEFLSERADVVNPAVIFDVDETILSNYDYIKSIDFGYERKLWDDYLANIDAKPINSTVDLYKSLIEKNIAVIFLTARSQETYHHTFENLKSVGIDKFDTLICRAEEYEKISSSEFKELERIRLTETGYNIIMCVGDQDSDMQGKNTGVKIKLPNKMYINN